LEHKPTALPIPLDLFESRAFHVAVDDRQLEARPVVFLLFFGSGLLGGERGPEGRPVEGGLFRYL
jgi:hypothetical protein